MVYSTLRPKCHFKKNLNFFILNYFNKNKFYKLKNIIIIYIFLKIFETAVTFIFQTATIHILENSPRQRSGHHTSLELKLQV